MPQLSKKCIPEAKAIIQELDALNMKINALAEQVNRDEKLKTRAQAWIQSLTRGNCEWPEFFVARKYADQLGIKGGILREQEME